MHIGKKIKEVLDSQPKDHTITWLARQIPCDRRNIYHIFTRPTIDTALLARISEILNHNFFLDLANDLNKD